MIWNLFACPARQTSLGLVGSMRPYQGYLGLACPNCLGKRAPPGDGHRLGPVKDHELPYRDFVLLCLDNRINDD